MIKTTRLVLNDVQRTDFGPFTDIQTDLRAREFLGGPVDPARIQRQFEVILEGTSLSHHWAVRNFESEFVGLITLSEHHDKEDQEISYQFLPKFWGRGFAYEAVSAVLLRVKNEMNLPRVIAETQAKNVRSRSLLERLQMRPIRTLVRFGEVQMIYSTD